MMRLSADVLSKARDNFSRYANVPCLLSFDEYVAPADVRRQAGPITYRSDAIASDVKLHHWMRRLHLGSQQCHILWQYLRCQSSEAMRASVNRHKTSPTFYFLSALFSRAIRLEVSQRAPPIF